MTKTRRNDDPDLPQKIHEQREDYTAWNDEPETLPNGELIAVAAVLAVGVSLILIAMVGLK